jgi:hypothetical protein
MACCLKKGNCHNPILNGKSSGNALQRAHYSSECRTHSANRPLDSEVLCELEICEQQRRGNARSHRLRVGTVEEAMQAGVESAIKWIDDGKQDFLTER